MPIKAANPVAPALIGLAAVAAALFGLGDLRVLDQGDYQRMVSRMLVVEPPSHGFHAITADWPMREGMPIANPSSGSLSLLIQALSLLQRIFSDHYSGAFALSVMLGICATSWFALGRSSLGHSRAGASLLLALGLLCTLLPHTLAFLGSFYGEALFIALLPAVLALLPVRKEGWLQAVVLFVIVTACATAKAQLFYLPGMMLIWRLLYLRHLPARSTSDSYHHPRRNSPVMLALILAQLMALLPIAAGDYARINAHNSLYFGSLIASPASASMAGHEPACIGIDYWGNRITALDDLQPIPGPPCQPASSPTLVSALKPYLSEPLLLVRVMRTALPAHARFDYFHLHQDTRYVQPPDNAIARGLGQVERLRNFMLDGFALFITLALILAASFVLPRNQAMCLSFCVALALSQIVIAILGEGVRDLGRHLLPAQITTLFALVMALCTLLFSPSRGQLMRKLLSGRA